MTLLVLNLEILAKVMDKWSVACTLASESVKICSSTIPLSDKHIWPNANLMLDGILPTDSLLLDFNLIHSSGWKKLITSCSFVMGSLNMNIDHMSSILELDNISLSYNAYKYEESPFGKLCQIRISVISLLNMDVASLIVPQDVDDIRIEQIGQIVRVVNHRHVPPTLLETVNLSHLQIPRIIRHESIEGRRSIPRKGKQKVRSLYKYEGTFIHLLFDNLGSILDNSASLRSGKLVCIHAEKVVNDASTRLLAQ